MAEARGSPKGSETPASRRDKPRPIRTGEKPSSKREASKGALAGETEQLVLTLSVATGEIVNIQKLDQAGHRHELSEDEYAELAMVDEASELESALEEAYEAGVADALREDGEELALRDLAIDRLLVRRMLRRELGQELLQRAIRHEILQREAPKRGMRA